MSFDQTATLVNDYVSTTKRDLYVFSGAIEPDSVNTFIDTILGKTGRNKSAALFLTTRGGDAHSAYRMTRVLRRFYGELRLLVAGLCKSAGTLAVIGADELAFGPAGELGPLDTQVAKPDELLPINSGLEIFQSLSILTSHAFDVFEQNMMSIIRKSGGAISTKTSSEIASQLATGLIGPIAAQIDPLRLGSAQRAMDVAKAYGKRLARKNVKDATLEKLVESYPDHAFVIDFDEAKELFNKVEQFTEAETKIFNQLSHLLRHPQDQPSIYDLGGVAAAHQSQVVQMPAQPAAQEQTNESRTEGGHSDTSAIRSGNARSNRSTKKQNGAAGGGQTEPTPTPQSGAA